MSMVGHGVSYVFVGHKRQGRLFLMQRLVLQPAFDDAVDAGVVVCMEGGCPDHRICLALSARLPCQVQDACITLVGSSRWGSSFIMRVMYSATSGLMYDPYRM